MAGSYTDSCSLVWARAVKIDDSACELVYERDTQVFNFTLSGVKILKYYHQLLELIDSPNSLFEITPPRIKSISNKIRSWFLRFSLDSVRIASNACLSACTCICAGEGH